MKNLEKALEKAVRRIVDEDMMYDEMGGDSCALLLYSSRLREACWMGRYLNGIQD